MPAVELERPADVTDLGPTAWPDGYVASRFRPGVEADNATALGRYRSVVLEVAREYLHFTRPTEPS